MNVCRGTKRDGSRCTVSVEPPNGYCWWHDPANGEQRSRAASRGGRRTGKGRASVELRRLQGRFEDLADAVLCEGNPLDPRVAAVACQLLQGARACIRDGLAAKEQEELIERLEALESALAARKQGYGYGA
jgi:hypothetical protein